MKKESPGSTDSSIFQALAAALAAGTLGGAAAVMLKRLIRDAQSEAVEQTALLTEINEFSPQQRRAFIIAAQNMISAIEKRHLPDGQQKTIVNAGRRNFREPWARDFGFSTYGLLELKEFKPVRETLEVFLQFQKEDGQFPIKVHSTNVLVRTIFSLLNRPQPISNPLKARYVSGFKSISLDGNALLVSAAIEYARKSNDIDFLSSHWQQITMALRWLEGFAPDADRLLSQQPYSDWADTVARSGKVLYTNIVYWKALQDFVAASRQYGLGDTGSHFATLAGELHASIKEHFWRPDLGYMVTSKQFDHLSAGGNLLAVAWGCTNQQETDSIFERLDDFGMSDPLPTKPLSGHYPRKFIAPLARLAGFPNYHEDVAWLWLGAWHIIALARSERIEHAEVLLQRISTVVARDDLVYEVYKDDGRHFSSLFYTSEAPLTWSAAMLVHAFSVYHRHPARNKFQK